MTAFSQTPDQEIWVGSTVVHRYDPASSTARPVPGLGGENVVNMAIDQQGSLWVAKEHVGVCRWQGDSWEVFAVEDGLASRLLSDLLVLSDGTLLASSDKGISRFDGKTWTTHAYPEWFAIGKRSGGMRESVDGSIWFNYTTEETRSPRLVLNKVERYCTVRHRPETTGPNTRIVHYLERVAQPGNSHISWSAQDPWGKTPKELLQYSWRLDGGDWSVFSHETSRTFLDMEHGRHVLEVRARDRAFNVDSTPDRIEFIVAAPLWLQPWFIGMVLLIVGGTTGYIWMLIYYHEKRLKDRSRHLVEMDQMKTSFFTNISHELNTPLMLILEPLKRVLKAETNEENRGRLSMALRNANRVATLVEQLLDFRKLEQGKIRIEAMEGDLMPYLLDSVELLQPLAQIHQVSCRMEGVEEYRGWFDPEKLKKIAQNLAGNAIKYTPAGGEVRLILEIGQDDVRGRMLSLVVEDTGIGIEPEHLQHIFDRFYRIPEKSLVDGSGIGLNLAKELVDLWGGSIRVESPIHEDVNRPGTRFVVKLPIDREAFPACGESDER